MFNPQVLSANIKMYRTAKGISQNALANALSISPQSVSKWECGTSVPDIGNLCMICDVLGVSLDLLLGNTNNDKKVMIGIDGGGTKTEFILFNENGVILERHMAGICNPNVIGTEACVNMLVSGINTLLTVNSNVVGVYVGSAGFLLGNNAPVVRNALKLRYPHMKIKCNTDILNAVATATDAENCIAAICGTGSSVLVKEGEKLTLLGGWGYLLCKAGSGFDIGRDALHYAAMDLDGMCEHTLITPLVKSKVGETVTDIVEKVYKNDTSYVASMSSVVFEAFQNGDKTAEHILNENAKSLAKIINHAAANYKCGNNLILSGGIVSKNESFVEIIKKYLDKNLILTIPKLPQSIGACILCAQNCGVNTDGLGETLFKQY